MFKSLYTFLSIIFSFTVLAQTSHFAASEGVDIHYRLIGEGPPVLIINGGPGFNCEGFEPMATEISKLGYQTILYDQRGTGQSRLSTLDSTTITMDLMVKDIEAVRKDLNIDEWMILGHSFGGIMMNYYTTKHPERVAGMIASSSGGVDLALLEDGGTSITSRLTEMERDSLNHWRTKIREGDNSDHARLKHATFLAPAYVVDRKFIPTVAERLTQGNLELNGIVWGDLRRIDYDTKEELSTFDKPVLLIQGEEDVVSPYLIAIADSVFSNDRIVLLEHSSHYGWLDNPKDYFGEINRFLSAYYPPENDEQAVKQALHNYIYSIYETDSALVEIYSQPELQKSGHYYSPKTESWSYSDMTFARLQHTAATYNSKGWIPAWAPAEIEIFEVKEKVASAKIKAIWGFDYVLLSKTDKPWMIDKVLWQSYSPEERNIYFGELSSHAEDDSTQRIKVGGVDKPGTLYRGSFSADGLEYYFFLKTGEGESYRIFRAQNGGHEIVNPEELELGNPESSDLYPIISPDGNKLIFTSYRETPDKSWPENAYLWYSEKKKNGKWSAPLFMEQLNQKGKYHSTPAFDASGNLVYRVTEPGWTSSATYVAVKKGNDYNLPEPYEPVNQWKDRLSDYHLWGGVPGHTHDYVILDVSALSSESRRLPSDQWISYLKEGEWSFPQPLREGVNRKESWDTFVFFNPEGTKLYFIRDFTELRSIPISKVITGKS